MLKHIKKNWNTVANSSKTFMGLFVKKKKLNVATYRKYLIIFSSIEGFYLCEVKKLHNYYLKWHNSLYIVWKP